MKIDDFTLIPFNFREDNDVRALLYFCPKSTNIIFYAKKMQKFAFYQTLSVAELMAKRQGFLLVPGSCLNWHKAKKYGHERKIKIGRNSFFELKPSEIEELTKTERIKLEEYLEEVKAG